MSESRKKVTFMDIYKLRDILNTTRTACTALSLLCYVIKGDKEIRDIAALYMDLKELERVVYGIHVLQSVIASIQVDKCHE